jgi:hypothetical protein
MRGITPEFVDMSKEILYPQIQGVTKGLPFYKLLKKVDKFQWTSEAQEALDALKKFLTTPPVLKPPR